MLRVLSLRVQQNSSTLRQTLLATPTPSPVMSSLLDAALNSDAAPTPSSDAGNLGSARMRSSSRPLAPPSESAAPQSDNEGVFRDDEVVGARPAGRRPLGPRADIPKVTDVTGETLSLRFQEFLEGCVRCLWTPHTTAY